MSFVRHDAGMLDFETLQAISWNTPTQATIWWKNGMVGTFSFSEKDADFARLTLDFELKSNKEAIDRTMAEGFFWLDKEKVKRQEDYEDYRQQRRELRAKGIYGNKSELAGRYTYEVHYDNGSKASGSGRVTSEAVDDDTTP